MGTAEISWSNVKQTKDGKWSNSGEASLEMRAILYSSARLIKACIRKDHNIDDGESNAFGDDNIK